MAAELNVPRTVSREAAALIGALVADTETLEAAGIGTAEEAPTECVFASVEAWEEVRELFPLVPRCIDENGFYHAGEVAE